MRLVDDPLVQPVQLRAPLPDRSSPDVALPLVLNSGEDSTSPEKRGSWNAFKFPDYVPATGIPLT
jgi:hypothetical protein